MRSTQRLLGSYKAPSVFYSPVLQNSLQQLQSSSSYPIKPNSLTAPIHSRLAQLSHPINSLHATAQQVAAGTGASVLGGLSLAWAGWAEHLGALGGIMITGMEVETAVGSGLFASALGIRWMIGKWEKAKRRFWRDWDRVGQGLERDLRVSVHMERLIWIFLIVDGVQVTLQRVISQQVVLVPTKACEGLNQLADKRKEEVAALKEELSALQEEASHT